MYTIANIMFGYNPLGSIDNKQLNILEHIEKLLNDDYEGYRDWTESLEEKYKFLTPKEKDSKTSRDTDHRAHIHPHFVKTKNLEPKIHIFYHGGADEPPVTLGYFLGEFDEACSSVDLSQITQIFSKITQEHRDKLDLALKGLDEQDRKIFTRHMKTPCFYILWSTS